MNPRSINFLIHNISLISWPIKKKDLPIGYFYFLVPLKENKYAGSVGSILIYVHLLRGGMYMIIPRLTYLLPCILCAII